MKKLIFGALLLSSGLQAINIDLPTYSEKSTRTSNVRLAHSILRNVTMKEYARIGILGAGIVSAAAISFSCAKYASEQFDNAHHMQQLQQVANNPDLSPTEEERRELQQIRKKVPRGISFTDHSNNLINQFWDHGAISSAESLLPAGAGIYLGRSLLKGVNHAPYRAPALALALIVCTIEVLREGVKEAFEDPKYRYENRTN